MLIFFAVCGRIIYNDEKKYYLERYMIALSASGISLSFGADTVLSDVTFAVNDGDKVGIIGVNGA